MRVPAGLLDGDDLLEDVEVAAGQEGAAVDDHVDLVGAVGDGVLHVGDLHRAAGAAAGERGGDGGDVEAGALQRLAGDAGEVAVDADGRDRRAGRVAGVGPLGLGGQGADLAGGVGALQRGQVDHRDRGVDRPGLRRRLDRAGAEHRDAGLGADLVDAGQAVQEGAEGRVGAGDVVVRRQRRCQSTRARHRAARRGRARGSCGHCPPGTAASERVLLRGGRAGASAPRPAVIRAPRTCRRRCGARCPPSLSQPCAVPRPARALAVIGCWGSGRLAGGRRPRDGDSSEERERDGRQERCEPAPHVCPSLGSWGWRHAIPVMSLCPDPRRRCSEQPGHARYGVARAADRRRPPAGPRPPVPHARRADRQRHVPRRAARAHPDAGLRGHPGPGASPRSRSPRRSPGRPATGWPRRR